MVPESFTYSISEQETTLSHSTIANDKHLKKIVAIEKVRKG
jgi:hypothetical protein